MLTYVYNLNNCIRYGVYYYIIFLHQFILYFFFQSISFLSCQDKAPLVIGHYYSSPPLLHSTRPLPSSPSVSQQARRQNTSWKRNIARAGGHRSRVPTWRNAPRPGCLRQRRRPPRPARPPREVTNAWCLPSPTPTQPRCLRLIDFSGVWLILRAIAVVP
jgi:hypothetical protein